MPDSTSPIAWIDVETSGLDPQSCDLLEIAAVVTTGGDYTPVDEGISVTIHPQSCAELSGPSAVAALAETMNPAVASMHTASGLFDDIAASRTMSLAEADAAVLRYLSSHVAPRGAILGGNSITLDRNFLEVHAPQTFAHLHYRSLDCTSVYELVRRLPGVGPEAELKPEPQGVAHRGMADVHTSIAQARLLSSVLAGEVAPTAV